jgi:hypothetical protein
LKSSVLPLKIQKLTQTKARERDRRREAVFKAQACDSGWCSLVLEEARCREPAAHWLAPLQVPGAGERFFYESYAESIGFLSAKPILSAAEIYIQNFRRSPSRRQGRKGRKNPVQGRRPTKGGNADEKAR